MGTEINLNLTSAKCCICESEDASIIGSGKDYEYQTSSHTFLARQCNSCGLVYLNPRPSVSEFKKIYPPDYHSLNFSKKNFGFVYEMRSRLETIRFLKLCKNLPDGARILDVGCGDGFHLNLLHERGKKSWLLEGIDLDKRAVEAANRSGLRVYSGSVEQITLPQNTYDLIFMIQTIEHVESPPDVLSAIYKLLRKGGRLVIVTDNTGSIDFKFFKNHYWGGYHFPRHWNLFNRSSLTKLALKTGFQMESLTTIISPVNWVYSIHNILVEKRAPDWLIKSFTLKSSGALAAFTALDFILQKFGKGALLQATLRK
jgi:2-polyprenyl-3-methyl-5-hydroxy-6-metoxy-1,4-benzoquinol methylase